MIPAGGRWGGEPRCGEETFPQRGRAGVGVCPAPSGGGLGWGCVSLPSPALGRAMHYPHVALRYAGLQVLPVARASSPGILATTVRCEP
jgi:hypothetical protein